MCPRKGGKTAKYLQLLELGLEQFADLVYLGVTACLDLGIDQVAVHRHFEYATLGWDELPRSHVRLKLGEQFVRHPDGARGIVSVCAVFDFDVPHGIFSWANGFCGASRLDSITLCTGGQLATGALAGDPGREADILWPFSFT